MKHVNILRTALAILFALIVFGSSMATAKEATEPSSQPGIEIELVNDTRYDMILVGYSTTGGTFPNPPPNDLLQSDVRSFLFAPAGDSKDLLDFELIYLIQENGTFFEIDFTLVEDSETVEGYTNYSTQRRGAAGNGFVIETEPPFDPNKRFQTLKTTFSKMLDAPLEMPAGPLDSDYGIKVTVSNETSYTMTLMGSELDWGKWTGAPPAQIEAGEKRKITARGRSGSWTGVEGRFTYSIDDANEPEMTVWFDTPYTGDDDFAVSVSGEGKDSYTYDFTGFDAEKIFQQIKLTISPSEE